MIKFLKKYKYIVFSIMGILIIIGGVYLKNSLIDNSVVINDIEDNDDILISDKEDNVVSDDKYYLVDIKGAVNNPGVYKVEVGTRINDQTTPNMIQKLKTLFVINPLISMGI